MNVDGLKAKLGRDGGLENHVAGQPFDTAKIDCKGDPQAGSKIIWNFNKAWNGDGSQSNWSYTYWDRGEQLPLYYEGKAKAISMTKRVEPQYLDKNGGDIFAKEKRIGVFGIEVDAPFDARGIQVLTYGYKSGDGPVRNLWPVPSHQCIQTWSWSNRKATSWRSSSTTTMTKRPSSSASSPSPVATSAHSPGSA